MILSVIGAAALLNMVYCTWVLGIGPMPSGQRARDLMVALCQEHLEQRLCSSEPTVYEWGSGWGGLTLSLRYMLNRHPQLSSKVRSIIAYERAWLPWLSSRTVHRLYDLFPRSSLDAIATDIVRADLLSSVSNLTEGDVVLCYLCPEQMQRIAESLDNQGKRGVQLISLGFALPGVNPTERYQVDHYFHDIIYIYDL